MLYLDNAATTPVREEAITAMAGLMRETYGNPSSLHAMGLAAEKAVQTARGEIAKALECPPRSVYFTSGATEANNWALEAAFQLRFPRRKTLLVAADSHPSVLEKAASLKARGAQLVPLPVDGEGRLRLDALEKALTDDVFLFSFAWVNNETGVVQEAASMVELVKSKAPRCLCHADGVQGFCKLPGVRRLPGLDFLAVSGHKVYGPKGVGALVAGDRLVVPPLLFGGGQEGGKRGGTENVAGIAGFACAAAWTRRETSETFDKARLCQSVFEAAILAGLPEAEVNGGAAGRSPYITNISVKNLRGEVLVHALSEKGVVISTGAACASRSEDSSHVLSAMGAGERRRRGGVRVSFPVEFTEGEARRAAALFCEAALEIREAVRDF